ncbi:MAG TPA: valine--tRNA ligase [Caproiciproducens sp.]|nr:valine--tRNA ligase [Caproiciproducens sp.]
MLGRCYDAKQIEKDMQNFWKEEKVYHYEPDERETYSIDTPPPTVSGSLHIGHIFSYTQAEIIARFQRMQGKNVFYPFGFDDNGLPSERLVEKEQKLLASSLPRSKFTRLCCDTTGKYIQEFQSLWQSMGFSVDWDLKYETISPLARKISQRSFIRLAQSGRAYQKETPVLWCTNCRTSIAQAELDTVEKDSTFNTIPFQAGDETLLVATTRPELLYGCVALFIHPDDKRFCRFIGKTATVPLYQFDIPILADEKADMEKGTGIVMCATFGDTTDLEWFDRHQLPYKRIVEANGRISEDVPFLGGFKIAEARSRIITLLDEKGLLLRSEKIRHVVTVHERCGKEVEIIPSRQWFIDILSQKDRFLAAADEINWYPASMKTRYLLWVQNLKWDWCISRQRYFGVPIPVWYCKKCGKPVFAQESQLPVNPTETAPLVPCACGCSEFIPETAVMDTWATSSLSPFINARQGEANERPLVPMSMRTQAHEIIRTWAFYTIVRSIYETGQIPWKDIMICGFVLAKKGEKISKSKGNAADSPKELIERNSADMLRYWAAGAHLGADTMFSQEELKISKRFLTKLWNAAKFTLAQLEQYDGASPESLLPADRWMLERCQEVQIKAAEILRQYEIGDARHEIDDLFWKDYCDNYLELVKERLYNPVSEQERQSARYALYHAFFIILKLYSPIVPHITEYLYQNGYRARERTKSIHLTRWNSDPVENSQFLAFGQLLKQSLFEVRRFKSEKSLSIKSEVETIFLTVPEELLPSFRRTENDLKSCCSCKNIMFEAGSEFSIKIVAEG